MIYKITRLPGKPIYISDTTVCHKLCTTKDNQDLCGVNGHTGECSTCEWNIINPDNREVK